MTVTIGAPAIFAPDALGAGRIVVEEGRVAALLGPGRADVRCDGPLVPGLVDLQCNGVGGADFGDPALGRDGWAAADAMLLAAGVTTVLPTLVSGTDVRHVARNCTLPDLAGFHLEGPYLNRARAGVHPLTALGPVDASILDDVPVRLVTLAPELDGAEDVVDTLLRRTFVAAGHSDATAEEAERAFDRGIRLVTHLWNATPPLHHRRPGIVGAALADDRVTVTLIGDGLHVHPLVVRLTWRCKGAARLAVVSDSIAGYSAAGLLGRVRLDGGVWRRSDGTIAGSAVTLDAAMRNMVAWGVSVPDAVTTVTATPAAAVGLNDRGRIAPGLRADLVALDDSLRVTGTWREGVPALHSRTGLDERPRFKVRVEPPRHG